MRSSWYLLTVPCSRCSSPKTPGALTYGTLAEGWVWVQRRAVGALALRTTTAFLTGRGELHSQGALPGKGSWSRAARPASVQMQPSMTVVSNGMDQSALSGCRSSYWHRRAYRGNGWSLASFHDQTRYYVPIDNVTRRTGGLDRAPVKNGRSSLQVTTGLSQTLSALPRQKQTCSPSDISECPVIPSPPITRPPNEALACTTHSIDQ